MKSLWILCFALLLYGQVARAQERVNPVTPALTKKSVRVPPMTGWMLDEETRKWVSHVGYIGDNYIRPANTAAFNWLQTGRFEYAGDSYFVFFYEAPWGWYKYPALKQDWVATVEYRYTVMALSEYARLVKLADKEGKASAAAYVGSITSPYSESRMMADIINHKYDIPFGYNKPAADNAAVNHLTLNIQTLKGKKVVRFDPTAAVFDADKEYFETDLATFKSLLIPLTAAEQHKADSIIALDPAPVDMGTQQSADDVKRAAEEFERQQAEAKQHAADEAAKKQAERQAEEAAFAAQKHKDPATVLTGWTPSQQLKAGACSWQHKGGDKAVFDYADLISFQYDGQQKYCFRYHLRGATPTSDREFSLLVLSPAQYNQIKSALATQDNTPVSASSSIYSYTYPSYGTEKILVNLLSDPGSSSGASCLDVSVRKGKVAFRLPTEGCPDSGDFPRSDAWGYFECDTKDFARLFTF